MTMTVNDMADQVRQARKSAWAKSSPSDAVVAIGKLNPEDEQVVRRVVSEAGYVGEEHEEMVRQVCDRVIGRIEALADDLPAQGGD